MRNVKSHRYLSFNEQLFVHLQSFKNDVNHICQNPFIAWEYFIPEHYWILDSDWSVGGE